jgi:hypothetical protein
MDAFQQMGFVPLANWNPTEIAAAFPNLNANNYQITSDPLPIYNCVAYASGITTHRIDFYRNKITGEIEGDQSSNLYVQHFTELGFEVCENPDYENHFEKIALYEDRKGNFTHVALQVNENKWTSKLGYLEDISHTSLEALEGQGNECYGKHCVYMKKKIENEK